MTLMKYKNLKESFIFKQDNRRDRKIEKPIKLIK